MLFQGLQVGDQVVRWLSGIVPQNLKITQVDVDGLIHCGPWTFSPLNGAEIDPDLGWDENKTGSFIKLPTTTNEETTMGDTQ